MNNYRTDIDGLRALAVLPVILFHAGFDWISGGFVGVDIFFVISGYLISNIIIKEIKSDKFSIREFYIRRLRRIMPALIFMIIVTLSIFQYVALPNQAVEAAESGISALLSVSNFYFWSKSGYFSSQVEYMPLLHTWSLGVEEQFYIILPITLILLNKIKKFSHFVIFAFTLFAFFACVWLSAHKASIAYYMLPSRSWELLIGVFIAAVGGSRIHKGFWHQALPGLGVAMIVVSVISIRSDMIFPGWVALAPCIGAALIIHSDGKSWVARHVLSSRPMITTGLISYSLYLWHWPVLAIFRIRTASHFLNTEIAIISILITFALAWFTWKFVETPFRDKRAMPAKRMFLILSGSSLVLIAGACISIAMSGFPGRLPKSAQNMLSASSDVDPFKDICAGLHDGKECRFGDSDAPITYAIIGDSHTSAMRAGIVASKIMGDATGTLFWQPGCALLEDAEMPGSIFRDECGVFKEGIWKKIEMHKEIHTIILGGRWPYLITGRQPEIGGSYIDWLVDEKTIKASADENVLVFKRSLDKTISRLTSMGMKVIIIGSTPEPGFDVPTTGALALYSGAVAPHGIPRKLVERRAGYADAIIAEVIKPHKDVRFVSIWKSFCDDKWCATERDGTVIYSDDDHISLSGALKVLAPAIGKLERTEAGRVAPQSRP